MQSRPRTDIFAPIRFLYRISPSLAALVACLLSSQAFATDVLDNGAMNVVDAASTDLEVRDGASATTLEVVEGAVIDEVPEQDPPLANEGRSIGVFGTSILNLMGGETAGSVQLGENASANIAGGLIGNDLTAADASTVAITGAGKVDDDVFLSGTVAFTMSGGEVGDQFFADGNSTVTLDETAGPINDDLFIRDSARLDMAGGDLGDELFVQGNATATITGGYVDDDVNANDDAVIQVDFIEVGDSVDATGNGIVHFNDGVVEGGFEAAGSSTIHIANGTFENVFSDGEEILAAGGTINITGGVFGTAGLSDGGSVAASVGGEVNFLGGTIAGQADGTAPEVAVSAVLNGKVNLQDLAFGDLSLDAANSGVVTANGFEADSVSVSAIAEGLVEIGGGTADSLSIFAELDGQVMLTGGVFDSIDANIESGSKLTIVGDSFVVNGIPIAELDTALNDADAFLEDTGEVRLVAGDVEGVLADGTPFSLSFTRAFAPAPAAQLFLTAVPEPSSALLMLLGGSMAWGMARRRQR